MRTGDRRHLDRLTRAILTAALAFGALLASCGDSSSTTGSSESPGPATVAKLSADEKAYADKVAATATSQGFTSEQGACVGTQIVKAFGLARATQLSFADENTPTLSQADAEKSVDVLDMCVNLAEFIVRSAQANAGLTDAEIAPCARLLDNAKLRTLFVGVEMTHQTDQAAQAAVQADLNSVIARCKK